MADSWTSQAVVEKRDCSMEMFLARNISTKVAFSIEINAIGGSSMAVRSVAGAKLGACGFGGAGLNHCV